MNRRYLAAVAAAAVALGLFGDAALAQDQQPPAPAPKLNLSNKWRIQCNSTAKSDGNIVFQITPKGGTATVITVPIAKGRTENSVAQDIKKQFKTVLDKKAFHVEVDDGEDVLVKRKGKTPDFELKLLESTVMNLQLDIEKE